MCNVPCNLCGDYDGCEIRYIKPIYFKIYKDNKHVGNLSTSIEEAQQFTFLNPEYTLVFYNKCFESDFNDDLLD